MEDGYEKGEQDGIQKGMQLTKKVIRMEAASKSIEEIANEYGITKEEIEDILKE